MPFLVVILVLVVRGRGLPLRSHVLDRLPIVGSGKVRPLTVAVLFAVMTFLMLVLFPVRWVDAFTVTMMFAILCLSVVVVTGLAGQLSLEPVRRRRRRCARRGPARDVVGLAVPARRLPERWS